MVYFPSLLERERENNNNNNNKYIYVCILFMPGWMNHKLESRLLGEISTTSDMQVILH